MPVVSMIDRSLPFASRALSRLNWVWVLAVVVLLLSPRWANAQWDSASFQLPGPDERVQALTSFNDGTGEALYVGGTFSAIDGEPMAKVAKWQNGVWSPLGDAFAYRGSVTTLVEFNGHLVAGGASPHVVTRWTGSNWEAMTAGLQATSDVRALHVFNGELIAAGSFSFNGAPRSFVKWTGSAWQALGTVTTAGYALVEFGGELFGASGTRVYRWDGVAWNIIGTFGSNVRTLGEFSGNLIAAGQFTTVNGAPANRIARWDGIAWSALGDGVTSPNGAVVLTLAVMSDRLVIGGVFSTVASVEARNIAEWDGNAWSAFGGGIEWDLAAAGVNALLPILDSKRQQTELVVGGLFSSAGSLAVNNIVRWSRAQWSRLSECSGCLGVSGPVRTMLTHDDGSGEALYVGGYCRFGGTARFNRIGRWNGLSWTSLGSGIDDGAFILSLAEFDDGSGGGSQLYAGGFFTRIGGVSAQHVARWDGQQWHALGDGVNGLVTALTVYDDGTGPALYAGGVFTMAGGNPTSRLAKWNGSTWSDVGGGVNGSAGGPAGIQDMLTWDDETGASLVVTGAFESVGSGTPLIVRGLAQWKGGVWSRIGASGLSASGTGRTLATWRTANGTMLACGGVFTSIDGVVSSGLAVWTGAAWQDIAPPSPFSLEAWRVFPVATGGCDELYVYSLFDVFGSAPISDYVSRWNGMQRRSVGSGLDDAAGAYWATSSGGAGTINYAGFALFQGRLYVAGDFTLAGGEPASNLAIWDVSASLSCPGDVNDNAVVDIDDLLAVISQWGPCSDCAGDPFPCGGDGVVNIDDLLAVIGAWGACP